MIYNAWIRDKHGWLKLNVLPHSKQLIEALALLTAARHKLNGKLLILPEGTEPCKSY